MNKEQLEDEWRKLSEEVLTGMQEWRLQHPKATLREIEMVVHERMMHLEARMVEELAVKSPAVDWSKQAPEEKPPVSSVEASWCHEGNRNDVCRRMGEKPSSWSEAMECARPVESGFFPLDEELALLPGSLTPVQQECLVHLAGWMPFERAAQMLWKINGVAVSETTARRQTEVAGAAYEAVQTAQAQRPKKKQGAGAHTKPVAKQVMSSDGAYVPLVGGSWAEVRTVVLGEVPEAKQEAGEQEVHTIALSYFSRMTDAETFADLAVVETRRRRLLCAKQVCAVMDGAEWLQGLIDLHRPDAIRILDFPHAAGYLSEIAELVRSAGTALPADWLAEQLHQLKHEGPTQMLKEIRSLREQHPHLEEVDKKVSSLEKREAQMQYPTYQAAGWPIGSGMVESANKQVVQVRLKGPGMHWAPSHVNPMLALRTAVCNDRWDEAWQEMTDYRRAARLQVRFDQHQQRYAALLRLVQIQGLLLRLRTHTSTAPKKKPVPASSSPGLPPPRRPASDHPWRRRFLAKK